MSENDLVIPLTRASVAGLRHRNLKNLDTERLRETEVELKKLEHELRSIIGTKMYNLTIKSKKHCGDFDVSEILSSPKDTLGYQVKGDQVFTTAFAAIDAVRTIFSKLEEPLEPIDALTRGVMLVAPTGYDHAALLSDYDQQKSANGGVTPAPSAPSSPLSVKSHASEKSSGGKRKKSIAAPLPLAKIDYKAAVTEGHRISSFASSGISLLSEAVANKSASLSGLSLAGQSSGRKPGRPRKEINETVADGRTAAQVSRDSRMTAKASADKAASPGQDSALSTAGTAGLGTAAPVGTPTAPADDQDQSPEQAFAIIHSIITASSTLLTQKEVEALCASRETRYFDTALQPLVAQVKARQKRQRSISCSSNEEQEWSETEVCGEKSSKDKTVRQSALPGGRAERLGSRNLQRETSFSSSADSSLSGKQAGGADGSDDGESEDSEGSRQSEPAESDLSFSGFRSALVKQVRSPPVATSCAENKNFTMPSDFKAKTTRSAAKSCSDDESDGYLSMEGEGEKEKKKKSKKRKRAAREKQKPGERKLRDTSIDKDMVQVYEELVRRAEVPRDGDPEEHYVLQETTADVDSVYSAGGPAVVEIGTLSNDEEFQNALKSINSKLAYALWNHVQLVCVSEAVIEYMLVEYLVNLKDLIQCHQGHYIEVDFVTAFHTMSISMLKQYRQEFHAIVADINLKVSIGDGSDSAKEARCKIQNDNTKSVVAFLRMIERKIANCCTSVGYKIENHFYKMNKSLEDRPTTKRPRGVDAASRNATLQMVLMQKMAKICEPLATGTGTGAAVSSAVPAAIISADLDLIFKIVEKCDEACIEKLMDARVNKSPRQLFPSQVKAQEKAEKRKVKLLASQSEASKPEETSPAFLLLKVPPSSTSAAVPVGSEVTSQVEKDPGQTLMDKYMVPINRTATKTPSSPKSASPSAIEPDSQTSQRCEKSLPKFNYPGEDRLLKTWYACFRLALKSVFVDCSGMKLQLSPSKNIPEELRMIILDFLLSLRDREINQDVIDELMKHACFNKLRCNLYLSYEEADYHNTRAVGYCYYISTFQLRCRAKANYELGVTEMRELNRLLHSDDVGADELRSDFQSHLQLTRDSIKFEGAEQTRREEFRRRPEKASEKFKKDYNSSLSKAFWGTSDFVVDADFNLTSFTTEKRFVEDIPSVDGVRWARLHDSTHVHETYENVGSEFLLCDVHKIMCDAPMNCNVFQDSHFFVVRNPTFDESKSAYNTMLLQLLGTVKHMLEGFSDIASVHERVKCILRGEPVVDDDKMTAALRTFLVAESTKSPQSVVDCILLDHDGPSHTTERVLVDLYADEGATTRKKSPPTPEELEKKLRLKNKEIKKLKRANEGLLQVIESYKQQYAIKSPGTAEASDTSASSITYNEGGDGDDHGDDDDAADGDCRLAQVTGTPEYTR